MKIDTICNALLETLAEASYNESTLFNYRGVIRRFHAFSKEKGASEYTPELGQAYADDVISKKTGKFSKQRYFSQGRFARLLTSYYYTGSFDLSTMKREIRVFFKECDSYVLRTKLLGRPYVFPALYWFLYCCGVRCAEARKLQCCDIHLGEGYVDILNTKSHRDRRLYLSEELIAYLGKYDNAISLCFPEREYFFPGGHGGICSPCALSANFRNIWISAGLKRDGKIKPRAYDFRHHFACANIMRWSEEGKNVHAMLPYLMRCMGHASLKSTYYYIHLIPDYFPQYTALTASTEALIPEVEDDEV